MESDYEEVVFEPVVSEMSTNQDDIIKMLMAISNQMMMNYQDIQQRLTGTDSHLSTELARIVQDNENFKKEIRQELLSLGTTGPSVVTSMTSVPLAASSTPNQPTVSPSPIAVNSNVSVTGLSSPTSLDFQAQMMVLLNDTFSKLSTVIGDLKGSDTKSEWPKFSGDLKKFRSWYLAIMVQLTIPPWQELYDVTTNDIVESTTNTMLNGKLYAKLLVSLEGQALQAMVSRKHIRANGILLLKELAQTYKPCNVPEVVAAKTSVWSNTKRLPNETIDSYYNHFHQLLDDLSYADEPISTKSAIHHFIFTLGSDFEPVQNNFRPGSLPSEWTTLDWPSILVLCRDYYNSIHPPGYSKKDSSSDSNGMTPAEHIVHHAKVKQWFMNPQKFKTAIETEQNKHPGKCLYHLSKSHPTVSYSAKKECEKLLAEQKASSVTTNSVAGQLRNRKEASPVLDEVVDDGSDLVTDESESNDTNEAELFYFARLRNPYLRLAKNTVSTSMMNHHNMRYPIIADSGANFLMFKKAEFFEFILPAKGSVLLGDGTTKIPIQGIGTVRCNVGSHVLVLENVRHVPTLEESINSLLIHIKQRHHSLQSCFESGFQIVFPTFQTQAVIGKDDIYLNATPHQDNNPDLTFLHTGHNIGTISACCRHVMSVSSPAQCTTKGSNVLQSLRQYYVDVKTKRQLNLDVPAGFRSTNAIQQQFRSFTPPRKSSSTDQNNISSDHSSSLNFSAGPDVTLPHPITEPSPSANIPILRCVDKPPSSLSSRLI
jgi:hypothetical protein